MAAEKSLADKLVLAADLGGTKLAVAAVTREGKIVARMSEAVDITSTLAPVKQMQRLAKELAGACGKFDAAGVAVPGLVRRNGTVWAPNLPGWQHVPLRARLTKSLGMPVVVESDRNAAAIGETWKGAAKGKQDAVLLIVGTGIGAGIVSEGRLVRGAHELSGCAGWLVVGDKFPEDAKRTGQLEYFAAGPAIGRAAGQDGKVAAEAARAGDKKAIAAFECVGEMLGRGVANIVSLFDPEVVVIGGGLATSADLFFPALKKTMLEYAQPLAAKQVRVAASRLGGDANLLGAARLAWDVARHR